MTDQQRNPMHVLSEEISAAIELLTRVDWQFDVLSQDGYLDQTQKDLWKDIRAYLRTTPL